jgi:superfamily II DNA or RNA helicase
VQSLQREKRREKFGPDYYDVIIVDEAHHAVSPSYRAVLDYFRKAKVLGVTATADRGDKRNLGEVFDCLAYTYSLPAAIRDGYLCKITALTMPLKIELGGVSVTAGDFSAGEVGSALDPYLGQIADEIATQASDRKTVIFLPLIATSQKMRDILNRRGINAKEVNGESTDRASILQWFDQAGPGSVLCNAMLLTEGWDCPSVDCICVLRPTKIRSLYAQMVGRGTRLHPGKDDLLLLDFLWHSERHELCRPSHLICEDQEISRRVAEILAEDSQGAAVDLQEAVEQATGSAQEEREEALRRLLDEQKHRKKALVDPLQYQMSIDPKEREYIPDEHNLKELAPPSQAQLAALEAAGIFPDEITCSGHASKLLDTVRLRRMEGLTTPKQIRCLEKYGFAQVGQWQFSQAKSLIDRIAGNGWRVPRDVNVQTYKPTKPVEVLQW